MTQRPFRAVVASADAEVRARVERVLRASGATTVLRCETAVEAMEACFEVGVDMAVLDEELSGVRGSEIAAILHDIAQEVEPVVLTRGERPGTDITSIELASPDFEAALLALATAVRRGSGGGAA